MKIALKVNMYANAEKILKIRQALQMLSTLRKESISIYILEFTEFIQSFGYLGKDLIFRIDF